MSNLLQIKKALHLVYYLVKLAIADLCQIAGFKLLKR